MILYPAIDIMGSRCVRLLYGDKERVTDYGDPLAYALKYSRAGAQILHIVDLDGAFTGGSVNGDVLKRIRAAVDIPIQLGGGIRSEQSASFYLDTIGIDRIVLGTAAATDAVLTDKLCSKYGDRIVGGIDCKDGYIAIKGWTETTKIKASDLILSLKGKGINTVVFTDISRDGALTGVNAEACSELQSLGVNVIASGGVSSLPDLELLLSSGVYGAIIGRALYENRFSIEEALTLCNR